MSETNNRIDDEDIQRVELLMRQNDFLNVNVLQALVSAEFDKSQFSLDKVKDVSRNFHVQASTLFNHYITLAKQLKQQQQSTPESVSDLPSVDPQEIQNETKLMQSALNELMHKLESAWVFAKEIHKFMTRSVPYQCNKRVESGCPSQGQWDAAFHTSKKLLNALQFKDLEGEGEDSPLPSRAETLLNKKLDQGLTPEEQKELDQLAREDSLTTEDLSDVTDAIESLISDQDPIETEMAVNEPEEDILTPKQDPSFKDDLSFLDDL